MKILLLSQFFSTTRGGGEYVFNIMSKSMANDGNKIWVLTNEVKDEKYPIHENIKIIKIPPKLEYQGGLPPGFSDNIRYSLNAIKNGFTIIKKEKIDIIHSNNFAPALAGSFLSSLTGITHITTIHDIFSLCGKDYWKRWGKQTNVSRLNVLLAPFFEKLMIKLKHDAIHTVSDTTKNDLEKFGAKGRIYVIPNAVEFDNESIVESDPFQFVYVGRLVFYKNLEVVIKAIKIVKDSYHNVKLIIVGDGPYRQILEKLVSELKLKDSVEFKGYVSTSEKIKQIATSQALVFPSLCEGFGLVILESFAHRKPVLVSDIRPLSNIVSHKKTGFVISAYDEKEWANGILAIINDPEKSKKMGLLGRKTLEEQYNITKMKDRILQMYKEVLKL